MDDRRRRGKPGIYMPAHPRVGQTGRQEFHKGHAEDHFKVLALFGTSGPTARRTPSSSRRRRRSSPGSSTTSCTSAASAPSSSRPSAAATSATSSSPSRTTADGQPRRVDVTNVYRKLALSRTHRTSWRRRASSCRFPLPRSIGLPGDSAAHRAAAPRPPARSHRRCPEQLERRARRAKETRGTQLASSCCLDCREP